MDLAALQVFLAVADERSFSKAAQKLYRTQPAISISIRKLEEWIGQPLFVRGTRAGQLTEAGNLLREYAERMLNLREEIRRSVEDLRELRHGRLSVGVNESSIHALLPALAKYRQKFPNIHVQIHRAFSREVPTEVLNYRLDPLHVQDVFRNIGPDYSRIVIDAKVQEAFKATTAKYTAEELIAKRDLVKQDTEKLLTDRLAPYNIIVQDFNIVDFQWTSAEFVAAIEQKQVAAQNVLKAQQDKAKQDVVNQQNLSISETQKQQAILQAQGQAEANRLLQQSFTPQLLLLETVKKWNGVYPLYVGGDNGSTLLQLPTGQTTPAPAATPAP